MTTEIDYADLLAPYLEGTADSPLEPQVIEELRKILIQLLITPIVMEI